ncbi:MAG: helix-turn-helix transcriptional regulator [Elusimicrobia bacterium]|nr:helix-turn-helix transcriptional regulator [Elusimicrobiota bacterium]
MKEELPGFSQAPAKDPTEIGRIVRQARKNAGLRQAQAAALCGVGTRFLSDLENGKATLHLGKVMQVLKGFGLRVVIKRKEFADERNA